LAGTSAPQSFTLTVDQAPAFTSAASTTFTMGSPGSFTATASGYPAPTIAESGTLPTGVTASGGTISGTPTQSGPFPITFTASNGVGTPASQNFTLTVNAVNSLLLSTTSLNFGSVNNNKSVTLPLTLTNEGSNTITISSIKIPGSNTEGSANDADDFSFVSHCGSSIPATVGHNSCIIDVTFSADNDYPSSSASLVITDSATGSPQSVTLAASVLDPLISLSPSSLSFGTVTVPTTKTVTVKNSGLTALNLSGMTISGTDFAFNPTSTTCTSTTSLAKGATCVIGVTFSPASTTSYSGTVTITSNALNGTAAPAGQTTVKINLSGK
jgi:hypothetical protein